MMIVTKTPLRISLVGGGSDLHEFYKNHPGEVISTTINKYVYVMVNWRFDGCIRISYSHSETVESIDGVEHEIAREALRKTGVRNGIEIGYMGDFPVGKAGTGLGASSALTIGLLHALRALKGEKVENKKLAEEACEIEIDILGRPIGKQDQYASACGGWNHITFHSDESVEITPVRMSKEGEQELEKNLLMFHTGLNTKSSEVLTEQKKNTKEKIETIKEMVGLVGRAKKVLEEGNTRYIGELLNENWMRKKTLAKEITNPFIDEMYEKARSAGALGGKILGSGGGGFLLFYVEDEKKGAVREALKNLQEITIAFEKQGSRVVYDDRENV